MKYSGIQPQYFPRLHYFARMVQADVFMVRDDCQYVRRHKYPDGSTDWSYQAHTPIKHPEGVFCLGVPVKHQPPTALTESCIAYESEWITKHINTLKTYYAKAPLYREVMPEIESLLRMTYPSLAVLGLTTICWGILRLLGNADIRVTDMTVETVNRTLSGIKSVPLREIRVASDSVSYPELAEKSASEKIVLLMKEVGADEDYCGGTAMNAYVDRQVFSENAIRITVQNWRCGMYPQLYPKRMEFLPNLSIIDLLMNVPSGHALNIIMA